MRKACPARSVATKVTLRDVVLAVLIGLLVVSVFGWLSGLPSAYCLEEYPCKAEFGYWQWENTK